MSNHDHCLYLIVPKGKQSVTDSVEKRSQLPYMGVFQFFEKLLVHNSTLNLEDVVIYFLLGFEGLLLYESFRFIA
ncbi:hypothetical protein EVA_21915 [gut metagenome]|uniref:Uncharacterized protein n=1 Tax=gut metagenome TaxID=749906 RepID=J9F4Y9_9ZZZZ